MHADLPVVSRDTRRAGVQVDGWDAAFAAPSLAANGADQPIHALAFYNGQLVIGGSFDTPWPGTARWDGSRWLSLTLTGHMVFEFIHYRNELVGSAHSYSPGQIIAWNGNRWHGFGPGLFTYNFYKTLEVYEGLLVVGGSELEIGHFRGEWLGAIAAWDGLGWGTLGSALRSGMVRDLIVYEGDLYAVGEFPLLGDARFARWNGVEWSAVGPPLNGLTYCVTEFQGDLIVGGDFTQAGSLPVHRLARWDGNAWSPLGEGVNSTVHGFAVYRNELIVSGTFTQAGGEAIRRLARWDGSHWKTMGLPVEANMASHWSDLLVQDDVLYATELMTQHPVHQIMTWDGEWHWLTGPNPTQAGLNAPARALAEYAGTLVVAGEFWDAGHAPAFHIAQWIDPTWQMLGLGTNDVVRALCVYRGDLVAAGDFTRASDTDAAYIARWDGTRWHALGAGFNQPVYSLTLHDDKLIAGGRFTAADDIGASKVAAWDGSTWSPLGLGVNSDVLALEVHDASLFAAGTFVASAGPVNRIARWDGAFWQPLGLGVDRPVLAMRSWNQQLVVGGTFTQAGGIPASHVAAWTGDAWAPLGAGFDAPVHALVYHAGTLYAGGDFTHSGARTTNHFARWNGTAWVDEGGGLNEVPHALAGLGTADLFAAGSFSTAGGTPSSFIARRNAYTGPTDVAPWHDIDSAVLASLDPPHRDAQGAIAIPYSIGRPDVPIVLSIFDARGRHIRRLEQSVRGPGQYTANWEGRSTSGAPVGRGVYFVQLRAGPLLLSQKLLYLRR